MRTQRSFVLFPLGKRRFALPSERVAELARPDRLHNFPHTTPLLAGVLVRRARIVPVCDIAPVLIGPEAPARKFYLIVARVAGSDWTAIPVSGECELATAEVRPPAPRLPDYVTGLLALTGSEIVEVLDLDQVIAAGPAGVQAEARA